ncbi:helix-turn-helix domain-containing protein [Haloferax namakaokahaiae]|uniref:Helix-turn-helix domain-containing protein n=1 Tax=Haloferax namakaokahaiae TaxID=1748331 RepID=A0ABD5ZJB0_9EURY
MTVIAEFTIRSDEFILGQVLARQPGVHIEMERIVPASGQVMPYLWVRGPDFAAFEEAVRGSEYVREIMTLDVVGESALYRVDWDEDIRSLLYGMAETNATILEARGNDDWYFRIRFDGHTDLTAFNKFCAEHDITFKLKRVYTLTEEQHGEYIFDLTDAQRKALVTAVTDGYFEVPRGTNLGEIGQKLGISEQSASENIRRGANSVLTKLLLAASIDEVQ